MRRRRRATIHELRKAIESLPRTTRLAMLEGIQTNTIIAGAYAHRGGICPMLAAHRAGGRTSAIAFARAWDQFAFRDSRSSRARPATERELLVLRSHLEASLLEDDSPAVDLAAAAEEHRRLLSPRQDRAADTRPRPEPRVRAGSPDRSGELRSRPGWARQPQIVRRHHDHRRTLAPLPGEARTERVEPDHAPVA